VAANQVENLIFFHSKQGILRTLILKGVHRLVAFFLGEGKVFQGRGQKHDRKTPKKKSQNTQFNIL